MLPSLSFCVLAVVWGWGGGPGEWSPPRRPAATGSQSFSGWPCSQPPPTHHGPHPTGVHPYPPPTSHTIHIDTGSQFSHPGKLPLDSTFKFSLHLPLPPFLSNLHQKQQPPPAPSPFCHQSVPPAENTPGSLNCFPPGACPGLGCTRTHRIIQKQLCDAPAAQISWCAEIPPRLELLQPF